MVENKTQSTHTHTKTAHCNSTGEIGISDGKMVTAKTGAYLIAFSEEETEEKLMHSDYILILMVKR